LSAAEFELKIDEKEGITYIPKKLRQQYSNRPIILPDDNAGVIYAPGTDTEKVIRSLLVLVEHLKLRIPPKEEKRT
jgi:hypothetical protein